MSTDTLGAPTAASEPPSVDVPVAAWRRWWRPIVVAVVAVVAVLVGVVVFTPLLSVRTVEVRGGDVAAQRAVERALGDQVGEPLLRVDQEAIREAAVAAAPNVADASVASQLPGTLRVDLTLRVPVMAWTSKGVTKAVDANGVMFAGKVDARTPKLFIKSTVDAGDRVELSRDAAAVLAALPDRMDGWVSAIAVRTRDDIRFRVQDGREVRWGSADDSARKAAALLPLLLSVKADLYDVSAPDLPTTS
jgi:cell division protein FtsQ